MERKPKIRSFYKNKEIHYSSVYNCVGSFSNNFSLRRYRIKIKVFVYNILHQRRWLAALSAWWPYLQRLVNDSHFLW